MKSVCIFAVICLMLFTAPGCQKETEQARVTGVIKDIQKAAEEKDIGNIKGRISESYSDLRGNNYRAINGLVIAYFYQYPKIAVYITALKVSVKGETAQATFRAVLTGKGSSGAAAPVLPESLGMYDFDVAFRKESGDWKVVSAEWERVGDEG
jgi:hypothetical protein